MNNYENPFAALHSEIAELRALIEDFTNTPPKATIEADPLTALQAAKVMGIAKQTLYQNINRIPHTKRFGRLYFFRAELLAFVEAGHANKKTA